MHILVGKVVLKALTELQISISHVNTTTLWLVLTISGIKKRITFSYMILNLTHTLIKLHELGSEASKTIINTRPDQSSQHETTSFKRKALNIRQAKNYYTWAYGVRKHWHRHILLWIDHSQQLYTVQHSDIPYTRFLGKWNTIGKLTTCQF